MTATLEPQVGSEDDFMEHIAEPTTAPDAPYGYKPDGTPRKRPPTRGPDAGKAGVSSKPKPKTPGVARASSKAGKDYQQGVAGLLQIAGMGLWMVPSLRPDAVALMEHTENVSRAAGQTAELRPEFASVLDKFMSVGPYGLLIGALLPIGLQIAANHDVLPGQLAAHMGVKSKAQVRADIAAMEAQAQAQATVLVEEDRAGHDDYSGI